jgi:hypothetical protein
MFARQLDLVSRVADDRFAEYGIGSAAVDALRARMLAWAATIRAAESDQPAGANR